MPRSRNADTADALLEAATRVLAEEGHRAVTARRLAREIDASTMAVYTHFGGMDELFAALWRGGFARFGTYLNSPPQTDDPLADWSAQGWAYRRFALENRHLYRVMFSEGIVVDHSGGDPAPDAEAAAEATFGSLVAHLQRCNAAGLLRVDDAVTAAHVVWSTVHGHVSIELTGFYARGGIDPVPIYRECLVRLALAFGADPERIRHVADGPVSRRR